MDVFRVRPSGRIARCALALLTTLPRPHGRGAGRTGYDLTWNVVPAGGDVPAMQGAYTLGASAGQPAADVSTGEGYTLAGGFWAGGTLVPTYVWLPVVLK